MTISPPNPINLAVITGGHAHDVPSFQRLCRSLDGVDAYVQHLDDFASSPQAVRDSYQVVLFYFMPLPEPTDEGLPWFMGKPRDALERLIETGQGIFVLHHALVAYRTWDFWNTVVGIADRREFGYAPDQTLRIEVADPDHPITRGLAAWELTDETYTVNLPGADSHVLLTTDHPKCMRTVAWTREVGKSRVFCLQSGHDNAAFSNPNFGALLQRGIEWLGAA